MVSISPRRKRHTTQEAHYTKAHDARGTPSKRHTKQKVHDARGTRHKRHTYTPPNRERKTKPRKNKREKNYVSVGKTSW